MKLKEHLKNKEVIVSVVLKNFLEAVLKEEGTKLDIEAWVYNGRMCYDNDGAEYEDSNQFFYLIKNKNNLLEIEESGCDRIIETNAENIEKEIRSFVAELMYYLPIENQYIESFRIIVEQESKLYYFNTVEELYKIALAYYR